MAKLIKKYVIKDFNKQLYVTPSSIFHLACLWDPHATDAILFDEKWQAKDFIKCIDGKFQIEKIYINE